MPPVAAAFADACPFTPARSGCLHIPNVAATPASLKGSGEIPPVPRSPSRAPLRPRQQPLSLCPQSPAVFTGTLNNTLCCQELLVLQRRADVREGPAAVGRDHKVPSLSFRSSGMSASNGSADRCSHGTPGHGQGSGHRETDRTRSCVPGASRSLLFSWFLSQVLLVGPKDASVLAHLL